MTRRLSPSLPLAALAPLAGLPASALADDSVGYFARRGRSLPLG